MTNGLKHLRFLLRIRSAIQFCVGFLPSVLYPGKSISLGYDTPPRRDNLPSVLNPGKSISLQGMIPRRDNLPRVLYPGESIQNPPKHDSRGIIITRQVNLHGVSYPGYFFFEPRI